MRAVTRSVKGYEDGDSPAVETREVVLNSIRGMAPRSRLVSLKVLDDEGNGEVSNLIAAIAHIQEKNGHGRLNLIHGVNISLGYDFDPEWFACGQSPLCVEINRLVRSGVVVVVAAGNTGYGALAAPADNECRYASHNQRSRQRGTSHHRRVHASRHAACVWRFVFFLKGPDWRWTNEAGRRCSG